MAGFGGSTGVSKGYVDGAIAQSTAITTLSSNQLTDVNGNITIAGFNCHKTGKLVWLNFNITVNAEIGAWQTLFALPAGWRPYTEKDGLVSKSSGSTLKYLYIRPADGAVRTRTENLPTGDSWVFDGVFFVP